MRVAALGKNGSITALLKTLGTLPPEERKSQGPLINGLKDRVNAALAARRDAFKDAALAARLNTESVDVTLPVREAPFEIGRVHPITQVTDELTAIFADMGFAVAEGPDIETDDYNFTKLNFPEDHPARGDARHVLLQSEAGRHAALAAHPHLAGAGAHHADARSRRSASSFPAAPIAATRDQTHTPMFHQVEGLVIDKGSHLGHLKWILEEFFKAFFEVDRVGMRFRPSFFPFTEPSLEVDIQCRRDKGEIRFGEGDDWMEILGCGMVHPNVLRNCGLDPDEYQGFAWGMGIDRIAMLKYGMPDLRAFFEADVRWLSHYGFRPLDFPTLAGGLSLVKSMMKFTLAWLKEHLDTDRPLGEIADKLTMIGLEVERIEDKAKQFAPFVIARVVEAKQHPNADRLRVCMVDTGDGDPIQVVCGAPNARTGMKGVFAPPGAFIPGKDMTLGVGKIRDVESRGMLVSEFELQISDDHEGIIDLPDDAPVGAALRANMPASTIR